MGTLTKAILLMGIGLGTVAALLYGAGYLARSIALRRPEWRLISSFALAILVVLLVVAAGLAINPYL